MKWQHIYIYFFHHSASLHLLVPSSRTFSTHAPFEPFSAPVPKTHHSHCSLRFHRSILSHYSHCSLRFHVSVRSDRSLHLCPKHLSYITWMRCLSLSGCEYNTVLTFYYMNLSAKLSEGKFIEYPQMNQICSKFAPSNSGIGYIGSGQSLYLS